EAAVAAREDTPGEPFLVGYLVAAGEPAPSITAVRSVLADALPDYMLPAAFVWLTALPLTESGKVDRRRLPAPPVRDAEFVPPRTRTEEELVQVWMEVFGGERIGAQDDFFALGGHSLRAMQIVARVRRCFGVELPVRAVFETPTVAALAARIEALRGDGAP